MANGLSFVYIFFGHGTGSRSHKFWGFLCIPFVFQLRFISVTWTRSVLGYFCPVLYEHEVLTKHQHMTISNPVTRQRKPSSTGSAYRNVKQKYIS